MTRQTIPYWHVDAFADSPFAGNQAAVMLLESWLPDEVLQAIAAENMFAETAFLVPADGRDADWELRWFTPHCEVRLCGHATLTAGHIVLSSDPTLQRARFATRQAGVLEVHRLASGYELALPAIATAPAPFPEACALLGGEPREVWRSSLGYAIFLFNEEAAVRALKPDMAGLAALGDTQFICTAPGDRVDVVSRVFVPGAGVAEDSVTGSAHAALAPFWASRLGKDRFTAHQASERGGRLVCRMDSESVWLGGDCVTVVEGSFYL